ncbi:MAG: permease [Duodenibacillus sp.]|nr:permease [Duodenibacillus sp.]
MRWLDELAGRALSALGVDTATALGGSLRFFLYDAVKITALLCALIFLVSYVQSYFPPEASRRTLGRFRGLAGMTAAALLGTVTPFCSCSSIPLFMGFTSAGLPLGVTFAFLISSPMVDLGSLVLLAGVFGFKVAAAYVLLGLAVAVAGGALIGRLGLEDDIEPAVRMAAFGELDLPGLTQAERLAVARTQTGMVLARVFPYIIAGVALGAGIHGWLPAGWVEGLLGSGSALGVPLAVLAGAPLYADIFGVIPVAEALLAKGAQIGTVLAFMMAVTTLSLPSIVMLRQAARPRLLGVFVAICVAGIALAGYVFNAAGPWLAAP